jgi:hypothetical protein
MIALCVACSGGDHFDQGDIQCPVLTTSQELTEPVPGWESQRGGIFEDNRVADGWWNKLKGKINEGRPAHHVKDVFFSSGPGQLSKRPVQRKEWMASGKRNVRWSFDKSQPAVWMSCSYYDTQVALERPLNKNPAECTVQYDDYRTPEKIECK